MKMKMKMKTAWRRRSWVANLQDPTQVTEWKFQWGRWSQFGVTLLASWGVEVCVRWPGGHYRAYDTRWAMWLFGWLEERWEREQMKYDDDPMGRLSDFE
jgi:hypothetical protein